MTRNSLELLQDAALVLTREGPVKDRLVDAYQRHLSLIDPSQIADETQRAEFRRLCAAMVRERPLPRETPVRASVRKMSTEEASGYAALVVKLYGAVARGGSPMPAQRVLPMAPIVQLFAADA